MLQAAPIRWPRLIADAASKLPHPDQTSKFRPPRRRNVVAGRGAPVCFRHRQPRRLVAVSQGLAPPSMRPCLIKRDNPDMTLDKSTMRSGQARSSSRCRLRRVSRFGIGAMPSRAGHASAIQLPMSACCLQWCRCEEALPQVHHQWRGQGVRSMSLRLAVWPATEDLAACSCWQSRGLPSAFPTARWRSPASISISAPGICRLLPFVCAVHPSAVMSRRPRIPVAGRIEWPTTDSDRTPADARFRFVFQEPRLMPWANELSATSCCRHPDACRRGKRGARLTRRWPRSAGLVPARLLPRELSGG